MQPNDAGAQGEEGVLSILLPNAHAAHKTPHELFSSPSELIRRAEFQWAPRVEDVASRLGVLSLGSMKTLLELYCVRNRLVCCFDIQEFGGQSLRTFSVKILIQGKVMGQICDTNKHISLVAAMKEALTGLVHEDSFHNLSPLADFIVEFTAIKAQVDFGGFEASLLLRHFCKEQGQKLEELIRQHKQTLIEPNERCLVDPLHVDDNVNLSEELADELLFEKEALCILKLLQVDVLELSSRFLASKVTQETLEAYAKNNALVVKFNSQETSYATRASREKIFCVSVDFCGQDMRVVAASRSEHVARLKAAEEALSFLSFAWKPNEKLRSSGWKASCKKPAPALLLDMPEEEKKRARLAKARECKGKMDAVVLANRCAEASSTTTLADDSMDLGLELKYKLGLKLKFQVKAQEYKITRLTGSCTQDVSHGDTIKCFPELWSGSMQVAAGQAVPVRALLVFGADLCLMLQVENSLGYLFVLLWSRRCRGCGCT